jgi:DNA-binding NtrC family response regulator
MGSELAERLSAKSPKLKVIYTSGYSPGMAGRDASLLAGRNFLPKPYSIGKLAQFVRECLDAPPKPGEQTLQPDPGSAEIAAPASTNAELNNWHSTNDAPDSNGAKAESRKLDSILRG